jgi:hypothetical protein
MRGVDHQQSGMFSCISAERRVPKDHPLRAVRVMVDAALKDRRGASTRSTLPAGGRRSRRRNFCARCYCRCCMRCAASGF